MTIDSHYIPAFSIEDVLLDKDTGAPLAGGVVTFYRDLQRSDPSGLKSVYQITGTSPNYTYTQLPNPMTLSSIGTFEDAMGNPVVPYFLPYTDDGDPNFGDIDYYYIVVQSEGLVEQFTREAVPYIPDAGGTGGLANNLVNELSNPQFAEVLFDTSAATYTYTFASPITNEVINIAPDWDIVATASGASSVIVGQVTPIGTENIVTNPGTLLNINSTGMTTIKLRQRLYGSPNLWGSGYISASFVANIVGGTSAPITLYYSQSNGAVANEPIISATLDASGVYDVYAGTYLIPASGSTQDFPNAYIDIEFALPVSRELNISSVMLASTGATSLDSIIYDQTSLNRQIDQLFHYYNPQLQYKPIPSHLVGWDFPLNPAQFSGRTVAASAIGANKSKYVWDQTIIFQSADSGVGVTGGPAGEIVLTAAATTQMALVQYLDATQARKILNQPMCLNIAANASTATVATVSLWYTIDPSLPVVTAGTNNSIVLTLDADSTVATNNGTWTQVPRIGNRGDATFTIGTGTATEFNDYSFSGWDLEGAAAANTATFFAIVISTASVTIAGTVSFYSVGLYSGDIATRPAPQTADEVLRECQYYYEQSYTPGVAAGTVTDLGAYSFNQNASVSGANPGTPNFYVTSSSFTIPFKNIKRAVPTVHLYSPVSGTIDNVRLRWYNAGALTQGDAASSIWTAIPSISNFIGQSVATQLATGTSTVTNIMGYIYCHFTAEARLGIV